MAESYKILGQSIIGTVATSLYTVPPGTTGMLMGFTICNTSTQVGNVNMWIVKNGDTASVKNKIFHNLSVVPNETSGGEMEGMFVEAGTQLLVNADVGDILGMTISGGEIS